MTGNCSIDGCEFTGSTSWGMWTHAKMHIRQADEIARRETEDYDEVREILADVEIDTDGRLVEPADPVIQNSDQLVLEAFEA